MLSTRVIKTVVRRPAMTLVMQRQLQPIGARMIHVDTSKESIKVGTISKKL